MDAATSGTNASGLRRYNERLILSTVRRLDGASKAELARATALSPQAVVRIVDGLEAEGLLRRTGKRTGGLGQPATVYRINGDRGYTVGVEVGRGGVTLVLLDFDGERQAIHRTVAAFPSIDAVLAEIGRFLDEHGAVASTHAGKMLLGVGIAMPWFPGAWHDHPAVAAGHASEWRAGDVEARLRAGIAAPVHFDNDGNAAALAQLLVGVGHDLQDFLSITLGPFVGGGLVLGGRVVHGRHGNAGAVASLPVAAGSGGYLIDHASLHALKETADPAAQRAWSAQCADALGFAVIGVNSLLDLEAVVIDGAMPPAVLTVVAAALVDRLAKDPPPDFFTPSIQVGTLGDAAAATGAGLLPLHGSYAPDLASLLKVRAAGPD